MSAKNIKNRFLSIQKACFKTVGFTFIELIIVVTIIAILSVSAWTALTGETDKARDAKRLSDVSTIQQALEQYYIKNSFYPQPTARNDEKEEHAWGYRNNKEAVASCVTKFDVDLNQILFDETYCGGDIKDVEGVVIGWKGVLDENAGKNSISIAKGIDTELLKAFGAEYIQNIGSDPKLSGDPDFRAKGVGEYIYATYRGPLAESDFKNGSTQYQLATTLERGGPDERETYIIGNYTQKRGKLKDPYSLIGSGENVLINEQTKGMNNEKVVNKSAKQKGIELKSKITSFEDSIEDLKDKTQISKDANKFLDRALDKLKDVEQDIEKERYDDAQNTFNEIRATMKEAINRFYRDAASEIYDNIRTAVKEDKSEKQKEVALEKIEDIEAIAKEIIRSAKNSRRFKDVKEEAKVRIQIDKKLEILKEDEISELLQILEDGSAGITEIISEDFEGSISGPGQSALDDYGFDTFYSDSEIYGSETGLEDSGDIDEDIGGVTRERAAMEEINDFDRFVDEIRERLLDIDKKKLEFKTEYSDILLDLSDIGNYVEDIQRKVKDINEGSDRFGRNELEELSEDLSQESNTRKRLELILIAESKITGGPQKAIQVEFDEAILGESAGQPGVARDPSNPMSPYSGIPYPLEISG